MAGFTPVEEVEGISMRPRDMVARVVKDFCREGWVGWVGWFGWVRWMGMVGWMRDQNIPTFMVGLAEEVELKGGGEEEEEEDTLGEAVEKVIQIPVGVVVDPTMLETISSECCYNNAGHGQVTITLL